MTHNKHLLWIGLGLILTSLMTVLALAAYQAVLWGPTLMKIASVTWNNAVVS